MEGATPIEKGEMDKLGSADRQLTHSGKMKIFNAIKEYIDAKMMVSFIPGEKEESVQKAEESLMGIILELKWIIE